MELWECDIDYAFGHQTTYWSTDHNDNNSGCAKNWGITLGDPDYTNAIQSVFAGQPFWLSFHGDSFTSGWIF
jgi:hypothetical protein